MDCYTDIDCVSGVTTIDKTDGACCPSLSEQNQMVFPSGTPIDQVSKCQMTLSYKNNTVASPVVFDCADQGKFKSNA